MSSYYFSKALFASAILLLLTWSPFRSEAQYCIPTCSSACTLGGGDYINSFSTTGGTSNITNNNTGCNGNTNNYVYYSAMTVTAATGNTVSWSFTNGSFNPDAYGIWVDWNGNGLFTDAGDNVYLSSGAISAGATVTGTITVPAGTTAGNKMMRVRCFMNVGTPGPCGSMLYGETEDYNFNVSANTTGCTGTPTAGTINATSTSICLSTPTTLYLTGYTPGTALQWQMSPTGTTWVNITGATSSAINLQTPIVTAQYRVVVSCLGTNFFAYSNAYSVTPGSSSVCQDSVWPGDVNYDHMVSNLDAVYIGIAYNVGGYARANASTSWMPQFSTSWSSSFANGVNYKNADCNGDSIINNADLAAVTANYGLTHPKDAYIPNDAKVAGLPDLYVDLTGISLIPGATVTAPIKLGNATASVTRIYGMAGTLKIMGAAPAAAPVLSFNPTWIGTAANTLGFSKAINTTTTDWAVTRTSHTNTSGYGTLGTVTFTVPATATGQMTFHMQGITLMDSTGAVTTNYNVVDNTASIHTSGIAGVNTRAEGGFITPNPSAGTAVLNIMLSGAGALGVTVTDMMGKTVWSQQTEAAGGVQEVTLPAVAAGIYNVHINAGTLKQTLRWQKQ